MTIRNFYFLCKWLNKLIRFDETNEKVEAIKQETNERVDAATASVKKVGELQTLVMKKTSSYYIGRAMGGKYNG